MKNEKKLSGLQGARYLVLAFAVALFTGCPDWSEEDLPARPDEDVEGYMRNLENLVEKETVLFPETLYIDGSHREFDIPVSIILPEDPVGPLPVVVWSHGGGFITPNPEHTNVSMQGQYWAEMFARGGYAVVLVTHYQPTDSDYDHFFESIGAAGDPDLCEEIACRANSYVKPLDVNAVIDGLSQIKDVLSPYGVEIDDDALAVGGWSGGAKTTMIVAGAAVNFHESLATFTARHEQPVAFIATSPAYEDVGFFEEGYGDVERPVFTATAHGDTSPENEARGEVTASDRVKAHYLMPALGNKMQLYLNSANTRHGSLNLSNEDTLFHRTVVGTTGLSFLNAYVKENSHALAYLECGIIGEILEMDPDLLPSPPVPIDPGRLPVPLWNIR